MSWPGGIELSRELVGGEPLAHEDEAVGGLVLVARDRHAATRGC